MEKYKIVVMIDGAWGTKYKQKIVQALNEEEAETKAYEFLDTIETRYDEESWGAYEEATIEDIIKIA